MDTVHEKMENLKNALRNLDSLAVAFSGGVDSTFLLKVAHDILGNRVLAITVRSPIFPESEFQEAVQFIAEHHIPNETITSEILEIQGFSSNPPNRCYFCKHELFSEVIELARKKDIRHIADGSNSDDVDDYRPGTQALLELGVISPLRAAKITKQDVRILSRAMNLPTWDKPALACLASRFPYGHQINRTKLAMVDKAEQLLKARGFKQVRVRHHDDMARIEVAPEERTRFFNSDLMDDIYDEFKKLGFAYTALDLKGYRMGSMNETIL